MLVQLIKLTKCKTLHTFYIWVGRIITVLNKNSSSDSQYEWMSDLTRRNRVGSEQRATPELCHRLGIIQVPVLPVDPALIRGVCLGSPARWLIEQHGSELPLLATDKEQANKAQRENPETTLISACCFFSACTALRMPLRAQCVGGAHFCHFIVISLFRQVTTGAGIMSLSAGQLPADIIALLCVLHGVRVLINCLSEASECVVVQWLGSLRSSEREDLYCLKVTAE